MQRTPPPSPPLPLPSPPPKPSFQLFEDPNTLGTQVYEEFHAFRLLLKEYKKVDTRGAARWELRAQRQLDSLNSTMLPYTRDTPLLQPKAGFAAPKYLFEHILQIEVEGSEEWMLRDIEEAFQTLRHHITHLRTQLVSAWGGNRLVLHIESLRLPKLLAYRQILPDVQGFQHQHPHLPAPCPSPEQMNKFMDDTKVEQKLVNDFPTIHEMSGDENIMNAAWNTLAYWTTECTSFWHLLRTHQYPVATNNSLAHRLEHTSHTLLEKRLGLRMQRIYRTESGM